MPGVQNQLVHEVCAAAAVKTSYSPPGFFKIETTEISSVQNSSFAHQIMPCHFFKKHNTSVF